MWSSLRHHPPTADCCRGEARAHLRELAGRPSTTHKVVKFQTRLRSSSPAATAGSTLPSPSFAARRAAPPPARPPWRASAAAAACQSSCVSASQPPSPSSEQHRPRSSGPKPLPRTGRRFLHEQPAPRRHPRRMLTARLRSTLKPLETPTQNEMSTAAVARPPPADPVRRRWCRRKPPPRPLRKPPPSGDAASPTAPKTLLVGGHS